jgi:hypothetical protein
MAGPPAQLASGSDRITPMAATAPIPSEPSGTGKRFSAANLRRHYAIYRDYIKHEDDLLNQRSTWHLLIQGFLFATLGVVGEWTFAKDAPNYLATQRENLIYVLAGVGISVAAAAFLSILAANNAIDQLQKDWDTIRSKFNIEDAALLPEIAGGGHPTAKSHGKLPAVCITVVVAVSWVVVIGMAVYDRGHKPTAPPPSPASQTPKPADIRK